jgi:hypothetical protein
MLAGIYSLVVNMVKLLSRNVAPHVNKMEIKYIIMWANLFIALFSTIMGFLFGLTFFKIIATICLIIFILIYLWGLHILNSK